MSRPDIRSPEDLKKLSVEGLQQLAEDMRQEILSACLKNGGHLGASLGAVELALALHRIFRSPDEPIVWDVGHQAYAHKLITGRWDRFSTLRTTGGISGFLSREESEHDLFGAGHSSTALSAALAMAWARGKDSPAQDPRWTVAVVGDGGLTAGVALEALNNVRALPLAPLLVVLNDNQMSISPNVGAIPAILAGGQASEFFAHFGFDYVGPLDGHDLNQLLGTLNGIRDGYEGRPVLLHVHTLKGKGYIPAEEQPTVYHGVSPVQTQAAQSKPARASYSDAFGEALCKLAQEDPRVVAVTAAMPEGTGLMGFARKFPDRFFDVGISEPHAVTFAASLATQGFRPVVAIYSTFLQRSLDAIIHDTALQKLPVIFAVDRAGLVGADGPTHHGAFDLAYLGLIPGFAIEAPSCLDDLETLLRGAVSSGGPVAIRYPRGGGPATLDPPLRGGARWHSKSERPDLIVVALGAAAPRVLKATAQAAAPARIAVLSCVSAKPIPQEIIEYVRANPAARLLTVEDGVIRGGFGQALAAGLGPRSGEFELAGYRDHFVAHGAVADLEHAEGLSEAALLSRIRVLLAGPGAMG